MADLNSEYSWQEAVRDGNLLDVSDIVSNLGIRIPRWPFSIRLPHPVINKRWNDVGELLVSALA